MGRDRQEKKLKKSGRVESDRDQSLDYPGATQLEDAEQARKRNR
ncbi:YpzI family protein [Halobacillus naozhouensis]|uniref:YpzI family protein n=1 Tax=Halobacillus naozhouensis TaxID=554880 RepID=A0ABY8IXV1_9BACI|nr:YpzI family protein [Halobacillus naozhouensis]WFT74647.1 YpzI family protein [Halobacillus naozhouensis]